MIALILEHFLNVSAHAVRLRDANVHDAPAIAQIRKSVERHVLHRSTAGDRRDAAARMMTAR